MLWFDEQKLFMLNFIFSIWMERILIYKQHTDIFLNKVSPIKRMYACFMYTLTKSSEFILTSDFCNEYQLASVHNLIKTENFRNEGETNATF
jgi:hypothetical protein